MLYSKYYTLENAPTGQVFEQVCVETLLSKFQKSCLEAGLDMSFKGELGTLWDKRGVDIRGIVGGRSLLRIDVTIDLDTKRDAVWRKAWTLDPEELSLEKVTRTNCVLTRDLLSAFAREEIKALPLFRKGKEIWREIVSRMLSKERAEVVIKLANSAPW